MVSAAQLAEKEKSKVENVLKSQDILTERYSRQHNMVFIFDDESPSPKSQAES